MLTHTAVATPEFSQPSSMQLMPINDWSHIRDTTACDFQLASRYGTCLLSWWDLPSLSLAYMQGAWTIQDCNRSEVSDWSLGAGLSECTEEFDLLTLGYIPDSFSFGSFEPLTLDAGTARTSVDGDMSDVSTSNSEVQSERTPISGSAAARALSRAWTKAKKQVPSQDVILVLAAHWAHETRGGTLMFNYNFGGIKGRSPDGLSCIREAHEGSGHRAHALLDRFRAYPNAKQGSEDYLSLLMRKYPQAIEAAERGDVTEFVSALKRGGYFTGSEEAYSHALSELATRAFEQGFDALGKLAASG